VTGRVLIMAGGTGGHIFPGLAVADVLRAEGVDVTWLGAEGGMELDKVPPTGIEVDRVHIQGLRGKGLGGWLALPVHLGRAVREARGAMKHRRPDCAVSFGGYVAGPGGLAAWLGGTPLVVHEQNRIPGLTNRFLARVAKTVLQAFDGALPGARTVGNPVRADVADLPAPAERWSKRSGPGRLLVTGGSQGARALNRILPEALAQIPEAQRPLVRHQAGAPDLAATRDRYHERAVRADVTAFIDDMAEAYAWADLVVCRSGALTVSELAAAGVGAVLVPFPHAVDDHQTANANVLVSAKAALLSPEAKLDAGILASQLESLLNDRDRTLALAEAARACALPGAARSVAQACLAFMPPTAAQELRT
jgi:UDP-N-acetylglucosamine--N-acetylmuramyl-(pentapeptide) pyrophosphoryl-undecaprenol N-acetylglucosamine transferase